MSYLSNILHAYENGESDWHCTKDELDALGYFDTVRMIGECPADERKQYGEVADLPVSDRLYIPGHVG